MKNNNLIDKHIISVNDLWKYPFGTKFIYKNNTLFYIDRFEDDIICTNGTRIIYLSELMENESGDIPDCIDGCSDENDDLPDCKDCEVFVFPWNSENLVQLKYGLEQNLCNLINEPYVHENTIKFIIKRIQILNELI